MIPSETVCLFGASGNEIYGFDLATQQWSMIQSPTPRDQVISDQGNVETYADGNPSSRHTYNGLVYLPPPYDALWSQGGSRWINGGGTNATWQYSFSNSSWTRKVDTTLNSVLGVVSAFDPVSGNVIHRGKYEITAYNPAENTYTQLLRNSGGWWLSYATAAVDPGRRYFVIVGDGNRGDETKVLDLETNTYFTPPISGDTEIVNVIAPGLAYDPVSDKMVAWGGGSDIYTLDLDTWVWTKVPVSGSVSPSAANKNGTFGRFRYVPSKNVFIVVNDVDRNVYLFKLTDGAVSAPSQPQNIQLNVIQD